MMARWQLKLATATTRTGGRAGGALCVTVCQSHCAAAAVCECVSVSSCARARSCVCACVTVTACVCARCGGPESTEQRHAAAAGPGSQPDRNAGPASKPRGVLLVHRLGGPCGPLGAAIAH
jgi:hypothetical protein